MPNSPVIVSLLVALSALAYAAWRMRARIHIGEDFALARRRLPALLAGVGMAVNCLPLWFLLALSAYAQATGIAALWLALASLVGLLVNGWFVAPRLRAQAASSMTLSQWFAATAGERMQGATLHTAAIIVVFTLTLTAATLLQWSAAALAATTGASFATTAILLALSLLTLTWLGGLWSASIIDVAQAAMVLLLLLTLAILAIVASGGIGAFAAGMTERAPPRGVWFGGYDGILAIALVVGVSFAAFGSVAQPHATTRYLACKDDQSWRRARWIALAWGALTLTCALFLGWGARVVFNDAVGVQQLTERMLAATTPDVVAAYFTSCLIFALIAACASPWIAAATHIATDLSRSQRAPSLAWFHAALVVVFVAVTCAALYLPAGGEDRLWLCWHALNSAFGPLLLVRLSGKRVRPGSSLGAMWSGFILTIVFHLMPDTPGDLLERSLPFIAAMGIALSGGERRRNPDRADRGERTVHDHLPI
jgi:sodium/proline symporter